MKVVLKYEEAESKEMHLTLKLTLTAQYASGPTKQVVKLFVDYYNKKLKEKDGFQDLDAEVLHLKVVGGNHIDREELVRDSLSAGAECYLLGPESLRAASEPPAAPPQPAAAPKSSAAPSPAAKPAQKDALGHVKCKRFGCKRTFDPDGPPQPCVFHKSPPIFHETAKWWSCCPDRRAYDWEEFMTIPGCQTGFCSASVQGQEKRFLGGCDLRGDAGPQRIDVDAPMDPRQKLEKLRKGLIAVGVDAELVTRAWDKLAQQSQGDVDAICTQLRQRFATALSTASA